MMNEHLTIRMYSASFNNFKVEVGNFFLTLIK